MVEAEARVTGSNAHGGHFAQSLADKSSFTVTWELVPGRGAFERSHELLIARAERAAKSSRIHAVSLADDPGGSPALSAAILAGEINRLGIEPIVHLTCKNKNRNELESLLYGLERSGVRNLLVMTGDYPKPAYMGGPKPVFDLDPVTLLGLIMELNSGRDAAGAGLRRLKPTRFRAGVVTSPFKTTEAEQMGQYYKLKKKLDAGAQFVISQLGYDGRKAHELPLVMKSLGYGHVPVIGNIYLLPLDPAKLLKRYALPGCHVPDRLLKRILDESAAPDRGKGRQLERGARMYALLKGMGFKGAHIGGTVSYDDLAAVLERGEELSRNWRDFIPEFTYPEPGGWYYFQLDPKSGLNSDIPSDRHRPRHAGGLWYYALRTLHNVAFRKDSIFFRPLRRIAAAVDGSFLEHTFTRLEHIAKGITNECLHCGDCALAELAYLCPASQCVKNQRNGPCGGSFEGWCEEFPREKKCIYVRAYERLRAHGSADQLGTTVVPPVDNELNQTSSWLNFFLGRDHLAKSTGIPPVARSHGVGTGPARSEKEFDHAYHR